MSIRSLARSLVRSFLSANSKRSAASQRLRNKRLLLEGLEQRRVMAFNPLVIEFSGTPFTSAPQSFTEVNGTVYFQASSRGFGAELWKSDGTTAGTQLVKDLVPGLDSGSYPTGLTNFNGTLYFTATDPLTSQSRLWKSDGTAAGTVVVDPVQAASPSQLTVVNNTLYFVAQRSGSNSTGLELWKTNGTAAGTVLVKDIVRGTTGSNPSNLTNVSGTLYFVATTASTGTELWKSDGTAASTVQVRDIVPGTYGSFPGKLTNVGGTLYFVANNVTNGTELWKSNGTSAGTTIVRDIGSGPAGSYPYYLTNVSGTLFFTVSAELWKTDGTALGTVQVETAPGGSSSPRALVNANGTLYFSAIDPAAGEELWKSDGTAAGTVLVKDIDSSISSTTPQGLFNIGSTLYFTASTSALGRELYKSDGTAAGTVLIKDIQPGATGSAPSYLTAAGGKLFFVAANDTSGRELWTSDGTTAGTSLTKDINPSTNGGSPSQTVTVGAVQFFVASNGPAGTELWKTDGTPAGTTLVRDIFAGFSGSYPSDLINVNGTLYFVASDGTGRELWKSNGTSAGTVMVADLNGAYSSTPQELVNIGSTLYFTVADNVSGRELWKSTGTAATTTLVSNINASAGSYPNKLIGVGSTLYFTADDGTNGRELWKSNGTGAGTVMVTNIGVGSASSYATNLTAVGGTLYFTAYTPFEGSELWKSNGTAAGTVVVKNIVPEAYSGSYPSQLTNVGGTLFFSARDAQGGSYELFKSNGTSAGTVVVEGVESLMSSPDRLTNVNGVLYFTAFEELQNTGVELWRSNGTLAGTTLVKDIVPGLDSSTPQKLFNANGSLVFTVNLPDTGEELWKSDGTAAGTLPVIDLWPGPQSSSITNMTMLGSLLTFTADDGSSGTELFVLAANQAPTVTVPVGPTNTNEDTAVVISGVAINDIDADVSKLQVNLVASSGTLTLNPNVIGGITSADVTGNGTSSVVVTASLAAINLTLVSPTGLTFAPALNQSTAATVVVTVNDLGNTGLGAALQSAGTVTINVAPVNDSPVLTVSAGPISYSENATPTLLDPAAVVSDIDSTSFDTGLVTVLLSAIDSADRLSVRNEGTAAGQIGVAGNTISFGGVDIGTILTGQAGGDLTIQLTSPADAVAVTALLRNLQFASISDNPIVAARNLIVTVTDGSGGSTAAGTITANVVPVNDAPVLTIAGGNISYIENAVPTLLDPTADVVDTESNWTGGSITATIASGASVNDVLAVNHQGFGLNQIGVSGSFVLFGTVAGPVVMATLSGGAAGVPLLVSLGANATTTSIQALLRNLTFQTLGDTPAVNTRSIAIEVSDGLLAGSNTANKNVDVTALNDIPVIDALGAAVTYTENAAQLVIAATATLVDVDSVDLAGGILTVSLTANGATTDILAVRNEGVGAGQIGVAGTSISFGGTVIGTSAGGTALTPLTIAFNVNATPLAAQALLRNITYRANSEVPSDLPRTVQFVVTDGDGGTSLPASKIVNVLPVNDRSVIASVPSTNSYVENGTPVLLAPAGTVSDIDSPNYSGGNLTVRYLSGGTASDLLAVRNEGFGTGQIGVAGLSILFGGQTIGTITSTGGVGTTFLRVFLNINSTPERTRALLRNITYSNTSDNPSTAPRTIEFLLNDGDGGTSIGVTQVMSVTAVNDAPVVTLPGVAGTYFSAAPAIDIDSTATVADSDSANFDTGVLTVSLAANGTTDDVLEVRNEGSGVGQIGVSGSDVTFSGIVIGSLSGGSGLVPLTITLNAAATPSAVQALARKITFRVNGAVASTLSRSISFQLTDGDGGSSALASTSVNVSL